MKNLIYIIILTIFGCKNPNTNVNYINFNGSKIHYRVSGNGEKTLLFIHGWGCDLNVWKYQEAYYKFNSKVVLVDLPGFGKTSKNFNDYNINLFSFAILKVINELGIENVHLIGHSLGHPIAKKIAQLIPEKVSSISIIDGVYFDFPKDLEKRSQYKEQLNQFASMFTGESRIENTKAFVNSLFIESTPQEIRTYTDTTMMQVPENIGANVMKNLISEEIWKKDKIQTHTLAVYANIPELPESNDSILNEWYPNLDYYEIDSVGHFLMMERPDELNKILDKFLNGK